MSVSFELDSKVGVHIIHSPTLGNPKCRDIIKHYKSMFTSWYVNSHVEFCRRQTNEVVHPLVKVDTSQP